MATKVVADALYEEWTGYMVPISDRNKQSFFLTHIRVSLLCIPGRLAFMVPEGTVQASKEDDTYEPHQ
ncbi:hypothetical protein STEG23_010447 [Scotinomys teguina]